MSLGDWGPWVLDGETYVLRNVETPHGYEVDLERCLDSAQVLDWLAQVAGKTWATPEVLAGLVHALDDVLALQTNLCGSGIGKRTSSGHVRRRVWRLTRQVVSS
jgi:hypothetical protein